MSIIPDWEIVNGEEGEKEREVEALPFSKNNATIEPDRYFAM